MIATAFTPSGLRGDCWLVQQNFRGEWSAVFSPTHCDGVSGRWSGAKRDIETGRRDDVVDKAREMRTAILVVWNNLPRLLTRRQ